MELWDISLNKIKGISEKRERCLNKLGILSLSDMLSFYPKSYENRTVLKKINSLTNGESVSIRAKVLSIQKRKINQKLVVTNILVSDDTGAVRLVFFNREYVVSTLKEDEEYTFFGTVSFEYGSLVIKQPEFEKATNTTFSDSYLPCYPLTQGLTQNIMRTIMKNALEYASLYMEETLPFELRQKYSLCEKLYAIKNIHFPKNENSLKSASERIAFEEIFYLILGLRTIKDRQKLKSGPYFSNYKIAEELAEKLPFELTDAQKNVVREICKDLKNKKCVNRLIQGDVGSGKTVVAAMVMLICASNGYQAALMAPTEILARQHYEELKKYFELFGFKTTLLVSDLRKKERDEALLSIKNGEAQIVIGTNALVFEKAEFNNLGLCVIDEQHRFGVNHRKRLREKGENVHTVLMTATPIPRTLALIIYADMDVSVIEKMPAGRRKVITKIAGENERNEIYNFMISELKKGNKAFVVCPLIEESESLDVENAVRLHNELQNGILKEFSVGLLHGRLKGSEKDSVMTDFAMGKYDVLVSTTVIEVGINIPEATVMIIENADRFGLACLHQLRGRVGRSHRQSYCFLTTQNKNSAGRLKIMEKTNDGFEISEADLKNRGPGDFFGTRQSGDMNIKLQNISYDMRIVSKAKECAVFISENDPQISKYENRNIKKQLNRMFNSSQNTM